MITYSNYYNGKPILANQSLGYGCDVDLLARLETLLSDMTQRHCKVFFIRFDVRFPINLNYPQDNIIFRNFMANLAKHYKRKKADPAYLWVREQDSSYNQHYHCILLLNGNKVQDYYPVLQKADQLWHQALGVNPQGLVHFCDKKNDGTRQKNGLMIRHDKYAELGVEDRCFQWGSYLAKINTKDATLYNTRSVGNSSIPQQLYQQSLETYQQNIII